MMHLTTKGRYAARIMVYLAAHADQPPATKHEIGKLEDISPNYVEQIMIRLKAAHLVRSHRGRSGGFSLARSADTITLAEVLKAVEGPVSPVPCLYGSCERERLCPTRPVWRKVADAIEQVFTTTTVGELARQSARQAADSASYEI